MSFNYEGLKGAPDDLDLVVMFKFLGEIRNASLMPGNVNSNLPPVLFWWFQNEDKEVNEFIENAVKNFDWKEEWMIIPAENQKFILIPKRMKEVEKMIQNTTDENIKITTESAIWLMKNDPEFGRRTNQDLERFSKYFRFAIEEYLRKKEGKV